MDAEHLFDRLAHQEQPPTSVDVRRAIVSGGAIRRRRRAGAAASALAACTAVMVTWLVLPQSGQRDGVAVAVPTGTPVTSTTPSGPSAEAAAEPTDAGFEKLKKKYPPLGKIASMPEIPIWMWLGRWSAASSEGPVLCSARDGGGATCAGFPPLGAKEFARTQGRTTGPLNEQQVRALHPDATARQLRELIEEQQRQNTLGRIFFGIARTEVHGITAVTTDGREVPASIARDAGAGLGVWAVRLPVGVTTESLIVTDAGGKTLQRIRGG
ncbi:hypothetical protein GCM10022224_009790 [Nonomuraea antimicrobica]|uniref:Uncharacterized protein n=1 Tax=Nonomuraea antimicrobica TaxID=561173 RepID=A0ABP7B5N9_9ACTN